MKYMGSKRSMLKNGLGELLSEQTNRFDRFVDLFSGGCLVSWFVAENFIKPVLSVDLQNYSSVLARSVISRTNRLDYETIFDEWIQRALVLCNESELFRSAMRLSRRNYDIPRYVRRARILCERISNLGPVWNAYGGYYFSAIQAFKFDSLINTLPDDPVERTACLAACISAASECAASPGHTAQPFQPTEKASRFIIESWNIDPFEKVRNNLQIICSKRANIVGDAIISDAQDIVPDLNQRDLVFIDPPYSNVQYSRFYHVLETISKETDRIQVSGQGRYPPLTERPQSRFSNIGQSRDALINMLSSIAERESTIIFTFPSGDSSNGLSGNLVREIASEWFTVTDRHTIVGQFSTLGGNNDIRQARNRSSELVLLLTPR